VFKTSKFKELNANINRVLLKLVDNQNICKYLYYNSSNPLSEATITDTTSLLYTLIFPYPTSTEIFKDTNGTPIASSVINVLFDKFKMTSNSKFKVGELIFVVLCHISLWRLDETSELRPFCILNEIDEMFSEQKVIGIGKEEFNRCNLEWADQNYSGYQLTYKDYEFH
jgi:hypothetical protein